jgi:hypothetical protein
VLFLLFLLLCHILYVFVNQDGPGRIRFVVGTQIVAFQTEIQKARPLIKGDTRVRCLRLDKVTKGFQSVGMDPSLEDHFHQGNHHFLVQRPMRPLSVELKAKLKHDDVGTKSTG